MNIKPVKTMPVFLTNDDVHSVYEFVAPCHRTVLPYHNMFCLMHFCYTRTMTSLTLLHLERPK